MLLLLLLLLLRAEGNKLLFGCVASLSFELPAIIIVAARSASGSCAGMVHVCHM